MVWAAEESPDGVVHVHGVYYIGNTGRGLGKKVIEHAKGRSGIPSRCLSKRIPNGAGAEFMGYMMKTLNDEETAARFLELNRSAERLRLFQGRGFFREGVGGRPLTLREAKKLSYQRSRSRAWSPDFAKGTEDYFCAVGTGSALDGGQSGVRGPQIKSQCRIKQQGP